MVGVYGNTNLLPVCVKGLRSLEEVNCAFLGRLNDTRQSLPSISPYPQVAVPPGTVFSSNPFGKFFPRIPDTKLSAKSPAPENTSCAISLPLSIADEIKLGMFPLLGPCPEAFVPFFGGTFGGNFGLDLVL